MKINVRVVDLQDDSQHTVIVESWETVKTVKTLIEEKTGIPGPEQHYYLGDQLIENSMPTEQLRKRAQLEGRLPPDDGDGVNLVEVKMYAGKEPINFHDLFFQDVIKKLQTHERIMKHITVRLRKKDDDTKYYFYVDIAFLTAETLKADLIKRLGPSSLTGLTADNILMYIRQEQPGRPLEGLQIRDCIGTRRAIEIEVYPMNPEVHVVCKVKKWGLCTQEQFTIRIQDHLLLNDLKEILVTRLRNLTNPKILHRDYTVGGLKFKLNGISINPTSEASLKRKYGIPAGELWLRAFNLNEGSLVVISL
ncbi:conserved hypothetical protein [Neospora caninum Liverpool]|uniref:Ubiquitin-like domain-containing protein n=1 Tax=Neospora caninum (strain Liverpool) TaxID=572307 RepID=F0VB12_NEOCL|nr:conserved hypothetical protein [Neospora caninum Liverpool]CBZ50834.1 conserved hypothetical protein [Neospora caninum Liverpool]CEL68135.1 TPA: hypothetical protein BN1204_039090 [Neospora caninum Liverpool]|eukprot:XP_003880867.1 conserved hypothetical protein [Neospora caninum Liverpool]